MRLLGNYKINSSNNYEKIFGTSALPGHWARFINELLEVLLYFKIEDIGVEEIRYDARSVPFL